MSPLEDTGSQMAQDVVLAAVHEAGHIELNAAKGRLFTRVELWHNSRQGWVGRVAFEKELDPLAAVMNPVLAAVDPALGFPASLLRGEEEHQAGQGAAQLSFRDELAALAAGFEA